jgi:hypothetical protein
MKRIIPFLALAFVALGCEKDGPTVPLDGPALALDCEKRPDHPQCSGEEPPPDGDVYTAIDLECPYILCQGVAHDISEPQGEQLHVVGWVYRNESPEIPVVWTGTPADIGDVDPVVLELPEGYYGSTPNGINDDPPYTIVGTAFGRSPKAPVVWEPAAGGGWQVGRVLALAAADSGHASHVNDDGKIAGRLYFGPTGIAVVWPSPTADPVQLYTPPGDISFARGLNNAGDVSGGVNSAGVITAALWTAEGTYCNLHPQGESSSIVWRMEERSGTEVLIAGRVSQQQPAVWTVDVANCGPDGGGFTYEPIAGAPAGRYSRAMDVRRVAGGWEAVGTHDVDRYNVQPLVWFENGASSELLNEKYGNALVINSVGHIVGNREAKGRSQAVLWTK